MSSLNSIQVFLLLLILRFRTESTVWLVYDWASVSMTQISSNASVWTAHNPLTPRSATKAGRPLTGSASHTIGSLITSLNAMDARSPKASITSLCRWKIKLPFLQSKAKGLLDITNPQIRSCLLTVTDVVQILPFKSITKF